MTVFGRNNIQLNGSGDRTMVFAHGFGCDQNMWRYVEPSFRDRYRTVLFDHVGAGRSDLNAYERDKYAALQGYASDLVEIGRALDLDDAVFVGHSRQRHDRCPCVNRGARNVRQAGNGGTFSTVH